MQPLKRIETAIEGLSGELDEIEALPRIEAQLQELNESVATMLDVLGEIRDELRAGRAPSAVE